MWSQDFERMGRNMTYKRYIGEELIKKLIRNETERDKK
jgi:hypothetical protein